MGIEFCKERTHNIKTGSQCLSRVSEAVAEHSWGASGPELPQPVAPMKRLGTCLYKRPDMALPALFFFSLVMFSQSLFLRWAEGEEVLSFPDFAVQLGCACLCPTRLMAAWQAAASVSTDAWVCFCSQHALPVHSAHGNVSLQKRHCNEVFQDPEWPLQGTVCVLLSCQLDGCSSYCCQLNSPNLTRVLFLAAEFFQSNTSTFSMRCKVRFKTTYVVMSL